MHRKSLRDRDPVSCLINHLVAYLNLLAEKLEAFTRARIDIVCTSCIFQIYAPIYEGRLYSRLRHKKCAGNYFEFRVNHVYFHSAQSNREFYFQVNNST